MSEHITVNQLPESERPIEKFIKSGADSLSDAELLAVILRTGSAEQNAIQLAQRILTGRQNNLLNLYELSYRELLAIPGIGRVKAAQLKAVAELSRRIAATTRKDQLRMMNSSAVADYYMEQLRHLQYEKFLAAFFDAKCAFLGDAVISRGSVSETSISVRDLFKCMLDCNAATMILVHNHPSGDPAPSRQDIRFTDRIGQMSQELGVSVADHIIIGDQRYYSFRDSGIL